MDNQIIIRPGRLEFLFMKFFVGQDQEEEYSENIESSVPYVNAPESSSPTAPTSIDIPDNINAGTTRITSHSFKDDEDFKRDMEIAEVVEIYLRQMCPQVVNPSEAAQLDNRHPWEVKNDRYKEFIEFYHQYLHDLKRVSYD